MMKISDMIAFPMTNEIMEMIIVMKKTGSVTMCWNGANRARMSKRKVD